MCFNHFGIRVLVLSQKYILLRKVEGKEGRRRANDLAKLKEKILVGIGTVRTLLHIRPATYRRHKIPLLLLEKWQKLSIWQFWITFYVCDKFFIGRTNVS